MTYLYPVDLLPDDNDTLLVTCSDIPELTTFGDDEADALRNAADALIAALGAYVDRGKDIPQPSDPQGRPTISPPTLVAAKLALYTLMRRQSVSKAELARRLRVDERQVRRMIDLTHKGRFDDLDAAFRALGYQPRLELDRAA